MDSLEVRRKIFNRIINIANEANSRKSGLAMQDYAEFGQIISYGEKIGMKINELQDEMNSLCSQIEGLMRRMDQIDEERKS